MAKRRKLRWGEPPAPMPTPHHPPPSRPASAAAPRYTSGKVKEPQLPSAHLRRNGPTVIMAFLVVDRMAYDESGLPVPKEEGQWR
jgi:hypothetical protein